MRIRMPLIFIGFDERRLFSVADERGRVMIPVFMSAQLAETYRQYFEDHSPGQKHEKRSLMTLMVETADKAINLLEWIQMVDPEADRIVIDPDTPTFGSEDAMCLRLQEFLRDLKQYQKDQAQQKDKKRHRPRNGRAK